MSVKTLIVAGGGAGGNFNNGGGGGGGAGGYIYNAALSLVSGTYSVVVGAAGNPSSFSSITAVSGGNGGIGASNGGNGGSGGGAGGGLYPYVGAGGTASQGNAGGASNGVSTHPESGGGGGGGSTGAGAAAGGSFNLSGGNGGIGTLNPITGSGFLAAGGGGGSQSGSGGTGGSGVGGNGSVTTPTAGATNTGSGGGGGQGAVAGAVGGSGIVQIAYFTDGSSGISPSSTGGTITTVGSLTVHTFTSDGTFTPVFTTLYWVGGTGTWDSSTATHWALSSGGAGGTIAPTAFNPVIIDSNSGSGTITLTTGVAFSLDFTGYTGTFAGSAALSLAGSLTMSGGMTNSYTGAITFTSSSAGNTITSNGTGLGSDVTFNGSGSWILQDNSFIKSITLTSGTLIGGTTIISLSGTGTVWNSNGGTFTAGTSTIKLTDTSSSAKTFAGGNQTYNNLWLTGAGTGAYTIQGSNVFADFKCDTPPHTINFTAGTETSISTFTVNGTAGNLITLQSTSAGTPWKITKNTSGFVSCDYLSIQDSLVI